MARLPATLERSGGSKAVGCLVYLVSVPFISLFLSIFLFLFVRLIFQAYGLPDDYSTYVFFAVLPLIFLGIVGWGIRDFRQRADLQITIREDRIVVRVGVKEDVVLFSQVESIRLVPARLDFACRLTRSPGKPITLSPEIAPFGVIRALLDETLIPVLIQRLDRRLIMGEQVSIQETLPRSGRSIRLGFLEVFLSILMFVNPLRFSLALALLRHGVLAMRQGWSGIRGGFVLDFRGLCPKSGAGVQPIPWDQLREVRSDDVGFALRDRDGPDFRVSALSENYLPAVRWIRTRMLRSKSSQGISVATDRDQSTTRNPQ